ncbi:MAG: ATP-binding protein [Burkholderiaceae bacterium]
MDGRASPAQAGAEAQGDEAFDEERWRSIDFDERRIQVLAEQSTGLRAPMAVAMTIVAALAWSHAPKPFVVIWLALTLLVREWRTRFVASMVRPSAWPLERRLALLPMSSLANGLANGLAAVFMIWTDSATDAVLTMILVSIGAGAVPTNSMVPASFHCYTAAIFGIMAVVWTLNGDWQGVAIAALLLLFYAVLSRSARDAYRMFRESYDIRSENAALAHELGQEQRRLAMARDEAVRANLDKSRFLAAASHDLRQPMQSLLLNSGELLRLPLSDDARLIGQDIAVGVVELRGMLDALLDVSKLDAGAVIPMLRPVAIDRLVERVAQGLRATAAAKSLRLDVRVEHGCTARTDPDLFKRVLANLIDNAIKFTLQGGVSVTAQSQADRIVVTVIDTGIGIPSENQVQIFEDLVQLQNPQRDRTKGHGLGLGIVRRLVDLLGLTVTVESAPGQGSRFVVTLPAVEAAVPEPAGVAACATPDLGGRRVLVVDDDSMVRGALFHALTSMGCAVRTAADGDEALLALASGPADVALVDWRLREGESGLDVIARLRAAQEDLPAVVVSADADETLRARTARIGIEMLRKPVDIDALAQSLLRASAGRER